MHACRYYLAKDWTPKKLEVLVDVPDHLSLEHLRGLGLQPGEQAQPEVCYALEMFRQPLPIASCVTAPEGNGLGSESG